MGRTRVYFLCAVWLAALLLVGGGTLRGETKSERMRRKRDPLGLYLGRDSLRIRMAETSRFAPYENNFFMLGMPVDRKPTKENSGVMFQISIQQRFFRRPLFWNSNFYVAYTQRSFWDIFLESSPFDDNNYNPSLHYTLPVMFRGYFAGVVDLGLEHLSNGRDGADSRSLNSISLRLKYYPHILFMIDLKAWLPFLYKEDNPDYFEYAGYGRVGLLFRYPRGGLRSSIYLNPSDKFRNWNVTYELGYSPWENYTVYFFLRFYSGYAERLLRYKEYTCNARVGITLAPSFMLFY